jgi:radical SAM superfamily enzyme YgiQ (UPF0313 family)
MKILLVSPCLPDEKRPRQFTLPQLTLSLIAGMTPPEHEVEICEEEYGNVVDFEGGYDLIGISIMTQTCHRGYQIANEFKKRGKMVVFGGIHASAMQEEALLFGDAVVIGEAEDGLWEEVLTDAMNHRLKSIYRLSALPSLKIHVFPRRDLVKCSSGKFKVAPIETTRGCPYNCDFCTVTRFFGTRQRHKPVSDIIADASSCPQKVLLFVDDNIAFFRKYALELFKEMIPLNKKWIGQASIGISKDKELMKMAYKSGCRALLIGFESMSDGGITTYRKTLKTVDENVLAVKRLRDNGILVMASLIFGLDSDTEDIFDLSYKFLSKSKSAFFQGCLMTPYPGTLVFENLKREGRILTDDWSKFDTKKVVIAPKNMSPERLAKGFNEIRKATYSYNSIFNRSLPYLMKGPVESILYFSLNAGARSRYKENRDDIIFRNPADSHVDFDINKYVKPFKNS